MVKVLCKGNFYANWLSDRRTVRLNQFVKIVPGDGLSTSLLARCMYYSQRLVTSPTLRKQIARLIARIIRAGHDSLQPGDDTAAQQGLQADGYTPLGQLLDAQQLADISAYLQDKSLSDRYAAPDRFQIASRPDHVRMAEYDLVDIINCPHILALANSARLLGLAEQYLHCTPTISSLMLRWSFPTDVPVGNVQQFHRDNDDWRHLKIMVYLTDVTESDGPHVYVLGTHHEAAPVWSTVDDDETICRRYGQEAVHVVTGPAGLGFAVDTSGIHKGEVPLAHPRLMLQIQYSLLPNFSNQYWPQPYAGAGAFDKYVNRLLVA